MPNSCIEEMRPSFTCWALIQKSSFFESLNFKSQFQRQWVSAPQLVSFPETSPSPQRTILQVQKAMSKSLVSFGFHFFLIAYRALSRAISENMDYLRISICSVAFCPQTTGSSSLLLELDHRSAISRATSLKIFCNEILRGLCYATGHGLATESRSCCKQSRKVGNSAGCNF